MFTLNFFSVALFISAIITGVVAVITYRRRAVIGATTLMWIMIALTWWSSVYAIENLSTSLAWHKFWSSAQYLGVAAIPPLWLVFAIQYSQQEKAPKARTLAWLGVIPIITIVMAWTNDWHGLLWPRMELIKFDDVTILDVDHGIYFWIQAVYAYLNIFAGTIIFARRTMQVGDAYRSQAVTMLLAAAVLLLGNGLYVFDLLPFKGLDITPFSFTFSGLLLAWGLFRHRLLDLMPVASENILQNMGDGVLVTDASNRIVYINPAFENLAGMLPETAIGQPAGEALFGWPNIFRGYEQKTLAEVEIPAGKSKIFLEMQVSPLFERGQLVGCIYVTRNITGRVDAENKSRLVRQTMSRETPGEFTPILLTLRARDGKILDINNEFIFQTGFSRDEAIGHTLLQLGFWDMETRTTLTNLLHEKSELKDYSLSIVAKSGEKQAWKLSISKSALDGEELVLWVARPNR